ncbi:MAG: PaaI family thioesterase [Anaerolineae bacterium]|nr:MAG: PaaI family thioesterase [Anaerolineae bacterium]
MTVKLPNSRSCFACGAENSIGLNLTFHVTGPDTIECVFTALPEYQGFPGVLHGGITATILDELVSRTYMIDDPNRLMYTARLTTRFRKHVPIGQPLRGVGTKVKDRGRMAEARAQLFGPDGDLLAEAEGLLADIGMALKQDELDALGWKVYPDEVAE